MLVSCTLAAATMIHSLVDLSLSIVRFELDQLRHLLQIIDKGIRAEMSALEVEIRRARKIRKSTHPMDDQRDSDDMASVGDLERYENYTGIVMAFVILERFLMDVLNIADSEIDNKSKDKEREFRSWRAYSKEFRSRLDIDLDSEPFASLTPFREIRNKIAHQGAQTPGERSANGYELGSEIPLSAEDVSRCMDLVETCCTNIRETYFEKALPYLKETARLRDAWDPLA
jgi:hypothetical protein